MKQLFTNNARTAVAVTLTAAGTSLQVADGSLLPAPAANEYFLATLFRVVAGVESGHEIVKCTDRVGNLLTIERAQEGTTASEFAAGSIVALRPTADSLQRLQLAQNIILSAIAGISATDLQAAIAELNSDKLEASSYTAADVLAKLLTVDGAGSGLDADLLDGQEGSYYDHRHAGWEAVAAAASSDFNLMTTSGSYLLPSGANETFSNAPNASVLSRGTILVQGNCDPYGVQTFFSRTDDGEIFVRSYNSSWGTWRKIWISGVEGGGQLKFPATQNASADANTLDDYEEGVFTPTIFGLTTAGTPTYSGQTGLYTKIGNRVMFDATIILTSKGGMAGSLKIDGLPFTIGGHQGGVSVGLVGGANITAGYAIQAQTAWATTNVQIYLTDAVAGNSPLQDTEITDTFSIRLSGVYHV